PGMSGYHVLDEMRREGLLERVPVIMLSAKTSKDAVVKGLELGASDYVGKPFHRAELLCRVRAHLEIKRQRDQLRLEVTAKADALEIAELSSKVKSQFLANVSHELRTPLNGIVGFIDLFSTLECTDEQVECLRNLQDKAGDLVEVVDDILDVAKIEARNVAAQIRRAVPSEIFERAVSQYRLAAQAKGLEFRSAWEPGPVPAVHTDAPKVQKIIEILLDNAVKFTGEGWIEATGTVRPHGDGRVALTIQVRDTGIGIPETKQEQVFEPFSQVDGSSTRNFGGMGLGLSLGRLYARLLGGDLTVESAPGKGSTFRATIVAEIGDPGSSRPRERVEATSAP
ncbi:MAG TPA: hybrid sensor histidine kinase/response regulator, partial [Planctomycetota bacterium]|nr:hybrid sensor histidine kinase/response regulator [Planctomycetota bacterium]